MLWVKHEKWKCVFFHRMFRWFAFHFYQRFLFDSLVMCFMSMFWKKVDYADFKPSPTCLWNVAPSAFTCDGFRNCEDNSDEEMCDCPLNRPFECDCYKSDDGCALWGVRGTIVGMQWFNRVRWLVGWKYLFKHKKTQTFIVEMMSALKVNDRKVDMAGGYDEFICCAIQGHKCGCIPGNENCTSSGKCIPNIGIGDARND